MGKQPSLVKILLLSANPKNTTKLRLDEETREIEQRLERARLRDNFRLFSKVAVRSRDFQRAMLDYNPQVVHFSGHGGGEEGIALEDETGQMKLVDTGALKALFKLYPDVQCVLLNACYSEIQAEALSECIPYVIGMSEQISDRAAIEFSVAFYDALGAGEEMDFAFNYACVAIQMAGISQQAHIPILHRKSASKQSPQFYVTAQEPELLSLANSSGKVNQLDDVIKLNAIGESSRKTEVLRNNTKIDHPINVQEAPNNPQDLNIASHQAYYLDSRDLIRTKKGTYQLVSILAQGDLTTVYEGIQISSDRVLRKIIVKVANNIKDNDLLTNEAQLLRLLQRDNSPQIKHFPILSDYFFTSDGCHATVLELIEGFDLISVREKYFDGLPEEHVVWILERALSALGFAHNNGIIHTNIEPTHLIIRPRDHNVYLIDWSYGINLTDPTNNTFKCLNAEFSAPEVSDKGKPLPASDLYSLGKTMIYLLGGNLTSNSLPKKIDKRLVSFVQSFLHNDSCLRIQDAWEAYWELKKLRNEVFGEHQFLEFQM